LIQFSQNPGWQHQELVARKESYISRDHALQFIKPARSSWAACNATQLNHKHTGDCRESAKKKDVRTTNIESAKAVADAVRTSLGPRGMDKMVRLLQHVSTYAMQEMVAVG
jgi:hypothetical protein